jgi:hypothetical protein
MWKESLCINYKLSGKSIVANHHSDIRETLKLHKNREKSACDMLFAWVLSSFSESRISLFCLNAMLVPHRV